MVNLVVSTREETKPPSPITMRKRSLYFSLFDSRRDSVSNGSCISKNSVLESVYLQATLPNFLWESPAYLHIQSTIISGGRTTMFSQGGWLHCSPPAVGRPWQGKKLVQHVSRLKKKRSLLTPSLPNTTQVLGSLLRQVGLGIKCAKWILWHHMI